MPCPASWKLLRDADYGVTGAATYDAAKSLLAANAYDLLICDVRLRGFNGLNLVMQSRSDYPDMAVIIISGYDEPLHEPRSEPVPGDVRRASRFGRQPSSIRSRTVSPMSGASAAGRASAWSAVSG